MSKDEAQSADLSPEEDVIELDAAAPAEGEEAPAEGAETLLDLVLAEHDARAAREAAAREATALPARIDGVVIGRITSLPELAGPVVTFPGAPAEGLPARAMTALDPGDLGREVALLFEGGDPHRPVVMGRMHAPAAAAQVEARADGERIELSAEKEIVLRCGKASITLTRAGKIIIRGAYLLARSSGVNRIQGGSVQIN